ncbi:MAG TPA: S41 family peptidase [Fimbriimonadales bacterium]|nr:S41 family peptidase [Fimbriimonadales bacterium]
MAFGQFHRLYLLFLSCIPLLLFNPPNQIDSNSPAQPILGMRYPAISPDASKIAFQWRGDIWVVPSSGGVARRLTDHVELDTRPIWSPDGEWIAFSSDRNGNFDIFALPVNGGETRQITYAANNEIASDWSPDGKWITFTTSRDRPFTGIFVVNVRTLQFRLIAEDYSGFSNPVFSPDGKTIVAQRYGFPWFRPRYFGSAAASLVLVDFTTGNSKFFRQNGFQHLFPKFDPSGENIYCVTCVEKTPSSRKLNEKPTKWTDTPQRTPNIWRISKEGKATQITKYVGEAIRWFSIARNGTIAFEKDGELFLLDNGKTTKLQIFATTDAKTNTKERQILTTGVQDAVIAPDEKTFAFVANYELWTVPLEKGEGRNKDDAIRLTDYPGYDAEIDWSKDGKTLYFVSDRENNQRLYALDVSTKKITPIWTRNEDVTRPRVSPDGKFLAFWVAGPEGGLYVWNTQATNEAKRLAHFPGPQFFGNTAGEFSWSPDSRWIAFTALQKGGTRNVWIVSVEGGNPENITKRNAYHSALGWSADGKYLYFNSNRANSGFYLLPLKPEGEAPGEIKLKYEKPKDPIRIEIDFRGITLRARRLFAQQADDNVISNPENGDILFLANGNLWKAKYDGKEVKQLTTGVSRFTLSKDGKAVFASKDGGLAKITLSDNPKIDNIEFRAELIQDSNLVRKAAFTQFWRMYHRGFYDGNFHGRDWTAIRNRYEPLLQGVGHRREFSDLLNMMVGELESSHSEVGTAPGGVSGPSMALPGFLFDYSYSGPGIRVAGFYENAPATYSKTAIKPGEYVLAINGTDVRLDEKLWEVLNNQNGRDITLTVNSEPKKEGARTITYGALSPGEWSELRYRQWVEANRRKVEEKTQGQVGYIHIRGMGGNDRTLFYEEFIEFKQNKKAMIMDVRFNGGGNIADSLIDLLERRVHGYYQVRDSWLELAPNDEVWEGITVVLANEHSYSNAEMFPYAMKARKLAKLVGMPTPGYVIWTWGGRLVDGTGIRMPMGAVYRLDGTPMENMGEEPDIRVPWTNEDFMKGNDPQLDRAIEETLREIKK